MKLNLKNDQVTVVENYAKKNCSRIGCGSFEKLDLQSLIDCRFFFYGLAT